MVMILVIFILVLKLFIVRSQPIQLSIRAVTADLKIFDREITGFWETLSGMLFDPEIKIPLIH